MTSRSVRDAYRKKMNKFNLIACIGILAVCSGVGGRIHIQGPGHVEKTPFASAVAGTREAKQTETPACAGTEASIQVTAVGTALSASEAWQRNEELQETRRKVKMDPYYPRFHLAPPVGWMNDPHPIYFEGAYHVFCQYGYILDRPRGAHLEIDATLRASDANQYGVVLLDGQQRIEAEYNAVSGSLPLGRQSGPLKLEQGVPLRLRIFVDGLVAEVFANRRLCLTEMIYPAQPKILQVGLFAPGGRATADRVDVWHLTGIRSCNAFVEQDGKGYLKTHDGAIHVVLLRS